jgi:hypothetical protein
MAEPAPSDKIVDDSRDLLGFHLKRILRATKTRVLIGVFVLIAAGIGFAIDPLFGLIGVVIALLVSLIVVYAMASSASTSSFFDVYAAERQMTRSGRGPLPASTPLLCKGDDRYAEQSLRGPLDDGIDGTLALYTYEDTYYDSDGNRQTNYYRYTVGLCEIPESAAHVPTLFARRKFGLKALEKVEDVFRSVERVELESEALDDRYEIFVAPEQDQVWLRRLLSPTFIVWLTDSAPEKFAFELVDGSLCCYVKGHRKKADGLDRMRVATAAVATRLRSESSE